MKLKQFMLENRTFYSNLNLTIRLLQKKIWSNKNYFMGKNYGKIYDK